MPLTIETPEGSDALHEFVRFRDRVYEGREAWWPTMVEFDLPTLEGTSPFAQGRRYQPFCIRDGNDIVARCAAVVDDRYLGHWNDAVGHVVMFEALGESSDATRMLMDEACGWLRSQGMRAARTGFGPLDMPYLIDAYDTLPPNMMRMNPPTYHRFLKDAGFEVERGWVDYKLEVTPELTARWENSVQAAASSGFEITPLAKVPFKQRVPQFHETWNTAFAAHWGMTPSIAAEYDEFFGSLEPVGALETSVLAYDGDTPVGVLFVSPEMTMGATGTRPFRDDEKLNFLGIGVLESARGKGVNMAMASYAYLELVRRGATWLSYTLVLDDNWPSRRTAEKLGASVCANYLTYRRNFTR